MSDSPLRAALNAIRQPDTLRVPSRLVTSGIVTPENAGKLLAIQRMAESEMRRWGLTAAGWTFQWDSARQRAGECRPRQKIISLSAPLAAIWPVPEIRDTVLHEIAHALTPGQRHNFRWKAKARAIGARPERCYDSTDLDMPAAKYTGTCPNGHVYQRNRLSAANKAGKTSCGKCSRTWDARYLVTWQEN